MRYAHGTLGCYCTLEISESLSLSHATKETNMRDTARVRQHGRIAYSIITEHGEEREQRVRGNESSIGQKVSGPFLLYTVLLLATYHNYLYGSLQSLHLCHRLFFPVYFGLSCIGGSTSVLSNKSILYINDIRGRILQLLFVTVRIRRKSAARKNQHANRS